MTQSASAGEGKLSHVGDLGHSDGSMAYSSTLWAVPESAAGPDRLSRVSADHNEIQAFFNILNILLGENRRLCEKPHDSVLVYSY